VAKVFNGCPANTLENSINLPSLAPTRKKAKENQFASVSIFNLPSAKRCCQGTGCRDTHDCLVAMARLVTSHPQSIISRR
jgi:hypothetical protein